VTEKGTVTIPVEIRKKYKLRRGSKVRFLDTEHGALLVPAPSFEELRGILSKEVAYEIIKELQVERRQEAARHKS
jgi:bifunctional DNA-binding transcriptional regulator/antitoxin component of YhaV-PrlF toxin-antitoxin module